jgi:MFS family permease
MGTAGIQNVSMIILADSVSLREQAVNTSIFQLLNGIGYSVGPVIGGYITNANWRYCFVLCAGMSVISIATIFLLRRDLKPGKVSLSRPTNNQTRLQAFGSGISTLDVGGIALFILGIGLVILGTAWGGSTYPWKSGAVIASLVLGVLLIAAFVAYEALLSPTRLLNRIFPKTVPMIPSSVLASKDVTLVCLIAAATGAAMYSVFYFIGIYFTLVENYDASKAGEQLLYYVPGLGVGVYFAMFVCNVYPRQTFWPLLSGTVIETAGIAVLAYGVKARDQTLVNVMMAIAGAGTGMRFMPSSLHLSGMFRPRLAPVYSLLRFALPFGGTLALTIMGSVFQNQMSRYFGSDSVISGANGTTTFSLHNQASLSAIGTLPPAEQKAIRSQGATATMWAFISILPILAISLVASVGLGNVWISKPKKEEEEKGEKTLAREDGLCPRHAPTSAGQPPSLEAVSGSEFVEESFLLALFRGNVRQLKKASAPHNASAPGGSTYVPKDSNGDVEARESRGSAEER